jgi:hypothetical protein
MKQPIVGYHQDDEGHWVAELRCGHSHHVRHNPPWQVRDWVTTPEGRASRLGVELECAQCEQNQSAHAHTVSPVAVSVSEALPADQDDGNVFHVLSEQARTRTTSQLWATTVGGLVSAGLLWWQHPSLSWLAAGFAATAAYGVWGLLDRAAHTRMRGAGTDQGATAPLTGLRNLAALAGVGAALWAVLDFMAAALGNWIH